MQNALESLLSNRFQALAQVLEAHREESIRQAATPVAPSSFPPSSAVADSSPGTSAADICASLGLAHPKAAEDVGRLGFLHGEQPGWHNSVVRNTIRPGLPLKLLPEVCHHLRVRPQGKCLCRQPGKSHLLHDPAATICAVCR